MNHNIQIVKEFRQKIWAGWYEHYKVIVDGVTMEGCIQIKRQFKRQQTITCYKNACVLGSDVQWLIRQNEEKNPLFEKERTIK